MTPNKQPECVECTEHEMIREGSIHQIKAMNCRVKPLDPVFFDTTATEQPEWGKVAEKWLEKESVRVSVLTDLQTLIKEIISSRDTYWKERVRKEVEGALTVVKLRIVYDRRQGTPAEETVQDIYDSIELKLTPITNEDTPTET